jgi:hypothetical protein
MHIEPSHSKEKAFRMVHRAAIYGAETRRAVDASGMEQD